MSHVKQLLRVHFVKRDIFSDLKRLSFRVGPGRGPWSRMGKSVVDKKIGKIDAQKKFNIPTMMFNHHIHGESDGACLCVWDEFFSRKNLPTFFFH